jgi:D-sedoheptulose 7-phosphate isomerase
MDTESFAPHYLAQFNAALQGIEVTGSSGSMKLDLGVAKAVEWVRQVQASKRKLFFIGNGGSAGISSHQAVDYWKNGGVRATAFNDSSLLTCIGNDLGYENVFSAPLAMFADEGDLALCISSSGKSENILRAAKTAREKGCTVFTFSGFSPDNPLRALGDLNFYVPSHSYGHVELIHELISHCILDAKMYCHDGVDIFNRNTKMGA